MNLCLISLLSMVFCLNGPVGPLYTKSRATICISIFLLHWCTLSLGMDKYTLFCFFLCLYVVIVNYLKKNNYLKTRGFDLYKGEAKSQWRF